MDDISEVEAQAAKIFERLKQIRDEADPRDPATAKRIKVLRAMYYELKHEIARRNGVPYQSAAKVKVNNEEMWGHTKYQTLWQDLDGNTWSDFEGCTWETILSAGAVASRSEVRHISRLTAETMQSCTARQRECIGLYYGEQMNMDDIGTNLGICKSTVCRTVARGLTNMGRTLIARLYIPQCVTSDGRFDYIRFVRDTKIMTDRQLEILWYSLAGESITEIAERLQVGKSTASRTLTRARNSLKEVGVDVIQARNYPPITRKMLVDMSEVEIAENLGLSLAFAYDRFWPGVEISGIPLLAYHICCLMAEGLSAELAATEVGCGESYAEMISQKYRKLDIVWDKALLPKYTPANRTERLRGGAILKAVRELMSNGGAAVDCISEDVLSQIERRRSLCVGA